MKKTPMNDWHREHGAKMVDFGGWDMPLQYETGILSEHLSTRRNGGIFDVSHMGRFLVSGRDAVVYLQHVLTNNVEALHTGQAQYTIIANPEGGVIDDAYLYRFNDNEYMLIVNASNTEKDWQHLKNEAQPIEHVELVDGTEELSMIAFQGPQTSRILDFLLEEGALPETGHNTLSEGVLAGVPVKMARTGYTGEPVGFELFVDAGSAAEIWDLLYTTGKSKGVVPVGLGARDTLRLEAGMPLYGHEFGTDPDANDIPAYSHPLCGVAVSFTPRKGDFIGRKALLGQYEQVKKLKVGNYLPSKELRRRVRPVALMDKGVLRNGDKLYIDDIEVGVITSGTACPYWLFTGEGANMEITDESVRRSIGLGLVNAEIKYGTPLHAESRGRRLSVQTVRYHGRSEAPPYFRAIPADWSKKVPTTESRPYEKKAAALVKRALDNHIWRQNQCVNLIPSEMTPSPIVRLLSISDPSGRYAEHKKMKAVFEREVFYYQGTDFISWVEERLADEFAEYLGCPLIEARIISGQMANTTVFSALVDHRNRTDRRSEAERIRLAMTNHLGKGGHLSAQPMGALRHFVARDPVTERFSVINFPVRKDNPYMIDLEETAKILDKNSPELLILGKSMVIHREPVRQIAAMLADMQQKPLLMYDMAHVLGLVGPHFQKPFEEGADIVTGSTHKTFFGTQRGVIGGNFTEDTASYKFWEAVRRRAFPGQLSNHHLGSLLGLYFAILEMNAFKGKYQPQVIANAKAFARALSSLGMKVQGDPDIGYTETHQVLVDVGYAEGCRVAENMEESNIIVNYQALPGDEGFTASSGLRLGVSEMTRFGMTEKDFEEFAVLFSDATKGADGTKEKVAAFRQRFVTMSFCFEEGVITPLLEQLKAQF
ncbi:MAG: glycine cleavage system aminomethyltransferase GcvT [Spirochaetales bacterium]|jgi:aminomethyltransferase|nr:glycine cleavage system aminomethyltransferase GcvT [Spirochaetales bacterium]